MLKERDKRILEFEGSWWLYPGPKDRAIQEYLRLSASRYYQALRRLGRTTELVVYPGEHHGIRRPTFQKDRLERYLDWYDRYVKGSGE